MFGQVVSKLCENKLRVNKLWLSCVRVSCV